MLIDGKASLSIKSVTRTAGEVTKVLGLDPTATAEIGDPVGRVRTGADGKPSMRERTHSIWVLDSPEALSAKESDFSAVQWLIDTIRPKRDALDSLREHYFIEVAWNGYSDRPQAGFLLPAELLAAMGALGVDFHGQLFVTQSEASIGESDAEKQGADESDAHDSNADGSGTNDPDLTAASAAALTIRA